jgi:hypothetical protein
MYDYFSYVCIFLVVVPNAQGLAWNACGGQEGDVAPLALVAQSTGGWELRLTVDRCEDKQYDVKLVARLDANVYTLLLTTWNTGAIVICVDDDLVSGGYRVV